jgi:hypothetical protein
VSYLSVDDGFAGDVENAGNCREAFGPVQPVAGVNFLTTTVDVHLNAVAVVFDFVKPWSPFGRLGLQCC